MSQEWKDNHARGIRQRGWTRGAETVYVAGIEDTLNYWSRQLESLRTENQRLIGRITAAVADRDNILTVVHAAVRSHNARGSDGPCNCDLCRLLPSEAQS